MKAKLGRPKLEITRSVLAGARFTPEEANLIDGAAAGSGRTKSEWIREILLSAAGAGSANPSRAGSGSVGLGTGDDFLD